VSYQRTALGFTSNEEQELLVAARGEAAENVKLDEMIKILRDQERLKLISTLASIGGAIYALAKIGEMIGSFRDRRKHVHL
jgi:hypothetical protein